MTQFQIGDIIGNRYKILKILGGKGITGRGVIFVCLDNEKQKRRKIIALKTLQKKYLESDFMIRAFKREALAWVQLDKHPFIVRAKYLEVIVGVPFIALEYIPPDKKGRNTLTHYLEHPIPAIQALKWSIQFCCGMEHARTKGITPHRDIKPDNLMITTHKILKITDFGLAMLLNQDIPMSKWKESAEQGEIGYTFLRYSRGDIFGGTVPWMAPEQFECEADLRSDIYSFGIVLYQMFNKGKLPFNYDNIDDYSNAHKNELIKKLNTEIFPIIEICLRKDPNERYQGFIELRIDLERKYSKITKKKPPRLPKKERLNSLEHYNKGMSFKILGFQDDAIIEFKHSLEKHRKFEFPHIQLGFIFKEKNRIYDSIREFKRALEINPKSIIALKELKNFSLKETNLR